MTTINGGQQKASDVSVEDIAGNFTGTNVEDVLAEISDSLVAQNEFTELTDTPASYSGSSLDLVRVNSGETALEFITLSSIETDPLSIHINGDSTTTASIPFAEGITIADGKKILGAGIGSTLTIDNIDGDLSVVADEITINSMDEILVLQGNGITLNASNTFITVLNQFRSIDGTAGAPAYSFTPDPDTGMYRSATNTLSFAAGGNQQLVISNVAITAREFVQFNDGVNFGGDGGLGWNPTVQVFQTTNEDGDDSFTWSLNEAIPEYIMHIGILQFKDNINVGFGTGSGNGLPDVTMDFDTSNLVLQRAIGSPDFQIDMPIKVLSDGTQEFCQFGPSPTAFSGADLADILVVTKTSSADQFIRGGAFIAEFTGSVNTTKEHYGLNAFVYTTPLSTGNLTRTSGGGGASGGRYGIRHQGSGLISLGGGISAFSNISGANKDGSYTDAYAFLAEGNKAGTGTGGMARSTNFWGKDSSGTNVIDAYGFLQKEMTNATNNYEMAIEGEGGIWFNINNETGVYINSASTNHLSFHAGNVDLVDLTANAITTEVLSEYVTIKVGGVAKKVAIVA